MELGLGDFVEVSYADEGGQGHCGIMEIHELFEDSQVTVDLCPHCMHNSLPVPILQEYICCTSVFSASYFSSQQFVLLDIRFTELSWLQHKHEFLCRCWWFSTIVYAAALMHAWHQLLSCNCSAVTHLPASA